MFSFAKKHTRLSIVAGALFVTSVCLAVVMYMTYQDSLRKYREEILQETYTQSTTTTHKQTIYLNDVPVHVEIVETPEDKRRGLSGRSHLPDGDGMLFVYASEDRYGFWMPDMHFSIDIVWIDSNHQIVHIESDVSPLSFPNVFKPDEPARFVLEVPAGFMAKNGLQEGAVLTF